MRKFLLYGYINQKRILITDSENITSASSYDEEFHLKEHEKVEFNFKIMNKLADGSPNPAFSAIYSRAKLTLMIKDKTDFTRYDLCITGLNPDFKELATSYSVTCEDLASSTYSKQGLGLSFDMTGEIDELAQEVLFRSRKNLGYLDSAKNFLDFNTVNTSVGLSVDGQSLKSINLSAGSVSATFARNRDLSLRPHIFSFNVLVNTTTTIIFRQLDVAGGTITSQSFVLSGAKGLITFTFTPREITHRFRVIFSNTTGTISAADFKIKKVINLSDVNHSLYLGTIDKEKFKSEHGTSYYKRVTLSLSNSNLYNGLIEIAKLFDARIVFDYEQNNFYFTNSKESKYKGFRLSPYFNLRTLNRSESTSEFSNVLHVRGGDNNFSIFPRIPAAFKDYFYDQIQNNFANFNTFATTKYSSTSVLNAVKAKIPVSDTVNKELQEIEVEDFAKACDKVPNFENTLYSIDYFKDIGKINTAQKVEFDRRVNDDLRKLNISLRINSELYQNANSLLSFQDTQAAFFARNMVVEDMALEQIENKIAELTPEEIYSDKWVALQNQKEASETARANYRFELMDVMGLTYTEDGTVNGVQLEDPNTLVLKVDSYPSNLLNVNGFYSVKNHGILQKYNSLLEQKDKEVNLLKEYSIRSNQLGLELLNVNLNSFTKREKEVEKAGLDSRIKRSRFLVGEYNTTTWEQIKKGQIDYILDFFPYLFNYTGVNKYMPTLIDYLSWQLGAGDADRVPPASWNGRTGNVMISKYTNPLGEPDLMMKFTANNPASSIQAPQIQFISGKNYRFTALVRANAAPTGTFVVAFGSRTITIPAAAIPSASSQWLLIDFRMNGAGTKVYSMPSGAEVTGLTINTSAFATNQLISPTFTFNQTSPTTTALYMYRPRVSEISVFDLTPDELYSLYDNPTLYGYEETALAQPSFKEGLYDLLYNRAYPNNLPNKKDLVIYNLYKDYGDFIVEGYYENSEELDAAGLMDQAILAHHKSKYPTLTYDTSIIDLAALGYPELNVEIGDLIKISDDPQLYMGYGEDTEYLQVSEISYSLRKPEEMKLVVAQDDETTKILQKILQII